MKNNFFKITKLISHRIINLSALFFLFFAFEARADLVDDLIKKHKLDPKNNPKDQCELMNSLQREIFEKGNRVGDKRPTCIGKEVCELFVPSYHLYKDGKWYSSDAEMIIYNPNSYQILGRAADIEIDSDNFYEPSIKEFRNYIKKHHNFYMVDVRTHKEFNKLKSQYDTKTNFNDSRLRLASRTTKPNKDISYLKAYGCYITESNLIKEYLQKNLTKNSN